MKYSEPLDVIGWRTDIWQPAGIKSLIEKLFRVRIGYWEDESRSIESSNGIFFTAFSGGRHAEKVKVHFDEPPHWMSMLVYLTPDSPKDTGTSFWQHRETGLIGKPTRRDALRLGVGPEELEAMLERDGWKRKCWLEIDRIGNVYNRAVMFPAGRSHSATRHFGSDLNNGRLYQSFHFPIVSRKHTPDQVSDAVLEKLIEMSGESQINIWHEKTGLSVESLTALYRLHERGAGYRKSRLYADYEIGRLERERDNDS